MFTVSVRHPCACLQMSFQKQGFGLQAQRVDSFRSYKQCYSRWKQLLDVLSLKIANFWVTFNSKSLLCYPQPRGEGAKKKMNNNFLMS